VAYAVIVQHPANAGLQVVPGTTGQPRRMPLTTANLPTYINA
jgi:hypothetical protein